MSSHKHRPQARLSRSTLVVGLYGTLALTGLIISAGRSDVDIYRIQGVSTVTRLWLSPLIGLIVGIAVVALSRMAVRRFLWAQQLHRDFHGLLAPLTSREIMVLALASSIGEEILFRGALQPVLGIWLQAGVFALLHIGPGRRFLPWTLSAFGLGVGFGYMVEWTGDIGGPIVAHFTINFLNLHFIGRASFPDAQSQHA